MRVIAIDGPAGSGKSTVARALTVRLGLAYLDTGAMYRGVAFAALRRGIDPDDTGPVARLAQQITIDVGDTVMIDGVDGTIEIRGPEVTRAVSAVAANPEVRRELRRRQREWGAAHNGGVIEGRDIGSVVFPDAELKVYLTASDAERAGRRSKEVLEMDYDAVAADIARRDSADSSRSAAPLVVADGAITVDTTGLSIDEVVDRVMALLHPPAGIPNPMPQTPVPPPASAIPPAGAPDPMPQGDSPLSPSDHPSAINEGRPARTAAEDRPLTRGERIFYQFARLVLVVFAKLYWRATTEGRENIPTDRPFVLCPIHRSNIDTVLMCVVTHRQLRYMAKDSLWKHGWSAKLLTALGGFPVNRDTADREALRTCEAALRRGEPVVMFPEGTRKAGPVVANLFEGAAFVALRGGVPIIPVGIGGSADAMPKGSKFLRPVKIRLVIGRPIEPPARTGAGARGSRRQVHELTAQLQAELQLLYDRANGRAG